MDDGRLLERLVARYSPSGAEAGAVREYVRAARRLGYRTRIDGAGNGIAVRGAGRPELLFLGHIDTVEGERPVRRVRGRIHGRGVVDAKGALVSALLAGRRFAGPGTLRIVAAVGEETDSRGARHLLRGARADAVIAGEPSGWDGVTIGYKGVYRCTATFRGRRSHYSGPAPTAADLAVDWVGAVRAWAAEHRGPSMFRSPTVKVIGWSTGPAGDAEEASVTLDLRLPPGMSVRSVREALPREPGRPLLRAIAQCDPVEVPPTSPVASALVNAIRAEGARPTLWRKGGTSDLNLVAPAWSVPGAAYGPGDSRLDHTARESLSLADLARSVSVLERAFAELLGAGDRPPTLRQSGGGA
ncbi:MAG TPA: M20/M25/M40 family metallo-hydrolase [Thermoplasmata archaeon]|nr:M20/M25/M40 family metallo-hydrolase [Thermoplasmata archaeon]